ncbi:MAG: YIP1 family protein [Bryobacterales bacterium]|nr:YIP1 family protein [Bryobacterales bacterium]
MSEPARLAAVFFDPKRAFSDIATRPSWWAPLLLNILAALAFVTAYSQRIGWERYLERALESNPRTESLTAEQRQRIVEQQAGLAAAFGYVGAVAGSALSLSAVAGLLLLASNVALGAAASFRQMFAVTCYGFLPNALSSLLGILMMFLKHPEDFDLENPTAFNIGAYLDPAATPKWLLAAAGSVDLFSIWAMLLLALGVSAAGQKVRYGRALAAILVLWLAWILLKVLRYALF